MDYTLQQLRYLIAVADHGSVSAAARSMYVSQPGVSAAISHLEEVFGIQCFVRHHAKGVTLTAAGQDFVAEAREVLTKASNLKRRAKELSEAVTGRLDIGCFSTVGPFFLPRILELFERQYPGVETTIFDGTTESLTRRLRSGIIEISLMYDLNLDSSFQKVPLLQLKPYVLLPKVHRLAQQPCVCLKDLVDDPLVLFDRPHHDEYLLSLFKGLGRQPKIGQKVRNFELVRGLVASGYGYAILNVRPALDHSYDGNYVVCLPIVDDVPPANIVLAVAGTNGTTRRVAAFIHSTMDCIKSFDPATFRWITPPAPTKFEAPFHVAETPLPQVAETV
ncbi:MAG: LysR family transcriptional regulator [Edaphobacter sp.]|uniref:LysR family transcriptional regulator n=1 Tax=Edaphobacter sp. TaxID=1934404 RepID=UPI00239F3BDA|nr:LysR family transcriptional regulator [Edaphobacter sp.]MDE1175750.1 LysR family transcriptional regulator [Edaphobacter sp.]